MRKNEKELIKCVNLLMLSPKSSFQLLVTLDGVKTQLRLGESGVERDGFLETGCSEIVFSESGIHVA